LNPPKNARVPWECLGSVSQPVPRPATAVNPIWASGPAAAAPNGGWKSGFFHGRVLGLHRRHRQRMWSIRLESEGWTLGHGILGLQRACRGCFQGAGHLSPNLEMMHFRQPPSDIRLSGKPISIGPAKDSDYLCWIMDNSLPRRRRKSMTGNKNSNRSVGQDQRPENRHRVRDSMGQSPKGLMPGNKALRVSTSSGRRKVPNTRLPDTEA
jgi:hypothetical protein